MAVVVEQRQRRVPLSTTRLGRAVARALAAVGRPGGIVEVTVVDDAEMRRLNGAHRGIHRRTDVLAFPLEAPGAGPLVGQLVIGADAAARQARRLRVPLALELDLLVTHGTLHLVGYDDRDPVEAELMHRREREILGDTPDRLWRGLLTTPRRSTADRPSTATPRPTPRPRLTASPRSTAIPRSTVPPRLTARPRLTAGRSRRPSRTAHPRLKPASHPSLP